jgi:hypothetical protein
VVLCANPLLDIINSNTHLLPTRLVVLLIVINFLEQNHGIAGGFIQAGNQVPFFIPSLLSGLATIVLLWVFLDLCDMGVIALILAPGIAQLVYQNWKWPMVVIKEIWGRSEK